MKRTKWLTIGIGVLVALGLIGRVSAFTFINSASAQGTGTLMEQVTNLQGPTGPGFEDRQGSQQEYLAKALGITVEKLQAAQQAAYQAAVQKALDEGLITQAQADQLLSDTMGGGRGLNRFIGPDSTIDMDALLAEQLGITTAELQAAREEASKLELEQRVTDGQITQDQADGMLAQQALREYVNPDAILASALGITTDQLKTYRDDGKNMSEILADLNLNAADVLTAQTRALVAAVQKAVADGVITQAQADAYLTGQINGMGFGRMGGMPGGKMGGRHGGMPDGMDGGLPGGFRGPMGQPGSGNNGIAPNNGSSPTTAPSGISS